MNYQTDLEWHRAFIHMLASRMYPAMYLELGCASGHTISRLTSLCGICVGVDRSAGPAPVDWVFVQKDTLDFIKDDLKRYPPVELAFIDGDHTASRVVSEVHALWPFMAQDGLIVMHDTYPENADMCVPSESGNAWEVGCILKGWAELVTLPFPPGLALIRKVPPNYLAWRSED